MDVEKERDALIQAFESSQSALTENAGYYESVRRPTAIGISTPPQMQELLAHVGIPRVYINALADRLELEGFVIAGKDEADQDMWDWWQKNDLDVESILGHTDALVHGRSYVTIAAPDERDPGVDPNVPIIRVEPPTALYAKIDPRTRQVTRAIRPVYNDDGDRITALTLYLPDQTLYFVQDAGQWVQDGAPVNHNMGMVPVVPLPNRTRLSDLYGTSEITPEIRSVTDAAARIMMNMQATAELMAVPQRLLFGVSPEDLGVDPGNPQAVIEAYLARIIAIEDPEAKAQQFSAAELRNFSEALDQIMKQAAAYCGLPPQYLSSASDNPASAEAIRASEARLVKNAERKASVFGAAWEQVMRVAWKVMNPGSEIPPEMFRMEAIWRDPSTPTYAAKADAASKLYANGTGIIPRERARIDMGYTVVEREQMAKWDAEEDPMRQLGSMYGKPPTSTPAASTDEAAAKAPAEGDTPEAKATE
ncbi:phage portal protein [Rhodococcus hoagii]|nr:phage portal protein [Prescottella equi]